MERQSGEPRYLPTIAADKTCGLVAAHAILAALFARERTGRGSFVEVPMFETMVASTLVEHFYGRHFEPALASPGYPRVLAPWRRPYRTLDDYVCMMPYTDAHWRRFFAEVGRARAGGRPALRRHRGPHPQHRGAVRACRGVHRRPLARPHGSRPASGSDIPAAPMHRLEDLENDPHLAGDRLLPHAAGWRERRRALPRRRRALRRPPARTSMPPRLGEHTRAVLREAGLSDDRIDALAAPVAARAERRPPKEVAV